LHPSNRCLSQQDWGDSMKSGTAWKSRRQLAGLEVSQCQQSLVRVDCRRACIRTSRESVWKELTGLRGDIDAYDASLAPWRSFVLAGAGWVEPERGDPFGGTPSSELPERCDVCVEPLGEPNAWCRRGASMAHSGCCRAFKIRASKPIGKDPVISGLSTPRRWLFSVGATHKNLWKQS
jgi:hypothetical protein